MSGLTLEEYNEAIANAVPLESVIVKSDKTQSIEKISPMAVPSWSFSHLSRNDGFWSDKFSIGCAGSHGQGLLNFVNWIIFGREEVSVNKRLRPVVIILSLIVIVGGAVAVIKSQTFANSSKPQTQTTNDPDWLTPEKKKEINEKVLSSQAEIIHSKYGDFFPVEVPNEYPSDQVANWDNQEEITAQTEQILYNNFVYEKKEKKN